MLILSRNTGQTILIGDGVSVSILGIKSGQVKLAIEAPAHTSVHRQEVAEKITMEGPQSTEPSSSVFRSE